MNLAQAYQTIITTLEPKLGIREAKNIAKYYLEDVFTCSNVLSELLLNENQIKAFKKDLFELAEGVPLQYVNGKAWFFGLELALNREVLIPRPETEELVDLLVKDNAKKKGPLKILEIGTGSGCIAVSIAKFLPQAQVLAIDLSASALQCAQSNANFHEVDVAFLKSNWLKEWETFLTNEFDCIVSNPPYIDILEMDKMGKSVLKYEPNLALFADEKGLIFYRTIAQFIMQSKLKPDLYLELNEFKADQIAGLFEELYEKVEILKDMQGKQRMLRALARGYISETKS